MSKSRNLANLLSDTGAVRSSKLSNVPVHADATTSATGLMTSADKTKMDGIETGAKDDQTKADIEALGIAASSITGALPAISGANLTGVIPTKSTIDALGIAATSVTGSQATAITANTAKETNYNQTKADIENLGIAASSITGALPAIDGASLTGINAVVVGTSLPDPVSSEGSLFYRSDTDVFYISDGSTWNLVSNAAPVTTGGTVTIAALAEGGTFSYNLGLDFSDDIDSDAALTYTLASGTLPGGVSLPSLGDTTMTGTASNVSSNTNYTWIVKAVDSSGNVVTQNYQQTINTVAATVTGGTVTISAVIETQSMSYDVDTDFTFGAGRVFSAYSLQSGTLPSGTSLNTSTGVISGTAGNVSSTTAYTFTIRGTDTDGDTTDQGYSWAITNIVPTATGGTVAITAINEGSSASYDVDTNFTFTTGSAFSAFAVQSGSLPSGLSLNTSTGVISGTASSNGSASFTIRGTDSDSDYVDQSYTWAINNIVATVTGGTVALSALNEGSSASYDVDTNFTHAAGAVLSAYSVSSGALPTGVSLNTSSGVLSGTATHNGAYSFNIRSTDTDGDTVDQSYTWAINNVVPTSTGGTVTITARNENASASYDVDTNFSFGAGKTFSAFAKVSGSLPSGLSLNTSTGVISGTMGSVGSTTAYTFTIRATDTDGDTVDQAYSWTINNLPEVTATFNSSGSWSVPAGVSNVNVSLVGAGGGGGGGVSSDNTGYTRGGTGGVGGYRTGNVSASGTMSYTVGSRGNGGASRNQTSSIAGNAGGGSTFGGLTSNGGAGGNRANHGGNGNTGSRGNPAASDPWSDRGAGGTGGYGNSAGSVGQYGRIYIKYYGNN